MIFTVLDVVAELERSLIVERVKAGLRYARARGKTLGRPRIIVDAALVASLRKQVRSGSEITEETGLSRGTANARVPACPKTQRYNSCPKTPSCAY